MNVQESKLIVDENIKTSDSKYDVSILRGQEKLEEAHGVHGGNISLYLLKALIALENPVTHFWWTKQHLYQIIFPI